MPIFWYSITSEKLDDLDVRNLKIFKARPFVLPGKAVTIPTFLTHPKRPELRLKSTTTTVISLRTHQWTITQYQLSGALATAEEMKFPR